MRLTVLVLATALAVAAPAAAQSDYAVPQKPKAVTLKATKKGKRKYKVRATVVLRFGQKRVDCEGGKATFTALGLGRLKTSFDRRCHADITVKADPGTKLKVRFGGTDALLPLSSRVIRLR